MNDQPLKRRGWKSTRLWSAGIAGVFATYFYVSVDYMVTFAEWADFIWKVVVIFALSEVGAKGAAAYKERGENE